MNLIENYQTNIRSIYQRITDLYNKGQPFFDDDVKVPQLTVDDPPEKIMNRALYLWTIRCIQDLQTAMNEIVGLYNGAGIIDYDVGDTELVKLWLPDSLLLNDDYFNRLANDWKQCNEVLDKLDKILQTFTN